MTSNRLDRTAVTLSSSGQESAPNTLGKGKKESSLTGPFLFSSLLDTTIAHHKQRVHAKTSAASFSKGKGEKDNAAEEGVQRQLSTGESLLPSRITKNPKAHNTSHQMESHSHASSRHDQPLVLNSATLDGQTGTGITKGALIDTETSLMASPVFPLDAGADLVLKYDIPLRLTDGEAFLTDLPLVNEGIPLTSADSEDVLTELITLADRDIAFPIEVPLVAVDRALYSSEPLLNALVNNLAAPCQDRGECPTQGAYSQVSPTIAKEGALSLSEPNPILQMTSKPININREIIKATSDDTVPFVNKPAAQASPIPEKTASTASSDQRIMGMDAFPVNHENLETAATMTRQDHTLASAPSKPGPMDHSQLPAGSDKEPILKDNLQSRELRKGKFTVQATAATLGRRSGMDRTAAVLASATDLPPIQDDRSVFKKNLLDHDPQKRTGHTMEPRIGESPLESRQPPVINDIFITQPRAARRSSPYEEGTKPLAVQLEKTSDGILGRRPKSVSVINPLHRGMVNQGSVEPNPTPAWERVIFASEDALPAGEQEIGHRLRSLESEGLPQRWDASNNPQQQRPLILSDRPMALHTNAIAERIADLKQMFHHDVSRVRIVLDPPNLGYVDLEIVVRHERIEVVMGTENASVQQALQSRADDIRNALQRQDLKVDTFQVFIQDQGDNRQPPQGGMMFEERQEHRMSYEQHEDALTEEPLFPIVNAQERVDGRLSFFA